MKKYILIYLSVLLFLSLNPWLRPDSAGITVGSSLTWDLIDHCVAYTGLTVMLLASCPPHRKHPLNTFAILAAVIVLGVSIEIAQFLFTTQRQFSLLDAEANASGALMGTLLYLSVVWLYNSRKTGI